MVIERIFISPARGAAQVECEAVTLEAGRGVAGDRNFDKDSEPGQNLTLVEAEEIERFCRERGRPVDLALTRRNLVTRGIRLNDLVGREFRVGSARLIGVELCEPCSTLGQRLADDSLSPAAVVKRWLGCGGLRVEILASGIVAPGAWVEVGD